MKKGLAVIAALAAVSTFCFTATEASGAEYYVRNSSCSDSGSGSSASPWCRSPGMNGWSGSASLQPGDTVYFDRAGVWTSSSTAVLRVTGGVSYVGDLWGSGTRAEFRATGRLNLGVVNFQEDHPTELTILKGFNINANNQVTSGIDLNHGQSHQPMTGAVKRIQNCEIHHVWSRSSQGQYSYGLIVSDWAGDNGVVENVEILDNIAHDMSRSCFNLYPGPNTNNRVGKVLVRGNECYYTAQDPDYSAGTGLGMKNNVYDVVAEYNYFHDILESGSNGLKINSDIAIGPMNIVLRHNILRNTGADGIHIRQYGSKDLIIYGNIIQPQSGYNAVKVDATTRDSFDMLLYNNTIYNGSVNVQSTSITGNIEVFNNIIYSNSTPLNDSGGKITSHGNNVYYRSGGGTLVSSGGSSYSSSNLQNYESTALSSNPSFVSTSNLPTGFVGSFGVDMRPNTNGLALQPGSSAMDSGTSLPAAYNRGINSVVRPQGAAWDRGAYEYDTGAPPPDTTPPSAPTGLTITSP